MIQSSRRLLKNRNTVAWLLMNAAIAFHVFDEAVTGFLPFYNELVLNQRECSGFFPMPIFSFDTWLVVLILFVTVSFALTPIVHRGGKIIRGVALALGVLMTLNAIVHLTGSLCLGRLLPGFWSSPFLFITAVFVVIRGVDTKSWVPIVKASSGRLP